MIITKDELNNYPPISVGRAKDLTGKKYGKLTVLYRVNQPSNLITKKPYWLCQCECGNYTIVISSTLLNNNITSCGCEARKNGLEKMKKYVEENCKLNLIGQKYGKLTVIEKIENNNKKTQWKCQCDCGNFCIASTSLLRSGHKKSCGCLAGKVNHIGERYGRLVIEQYLGDSKYLCKCDCENEYIAYMKRLKSGYTISCGKCIAKEQRELKYNGKKYNKLTVLYESLERTKNNEIQWVCQCECGNIITVRKNSVILGHTTSCGCIHSIGENTIATILQNHMIKFKKEYTFSDCYFQDIHSHLRFDFGILDNNNQLLYLIEYDGPQHFEVRNNISWFNEESYKKIKERDNYKNNYCKKNNIPLIRIPYTHLKCITIKDLSLETSEFILK